MSVCQVSIGNDLLVAKDGWAGGFAERGGAEALRSLCAEERSCCCGGRPGAGAAVLRELGKA